MTRLSVVASAIMASLVVWQLRGADIPQWALVVTGVDWLAEAVFAVVIFAASYAVTLVALMGLLIGQHVSKFSLRQLSFEFVEEAEDLKEIDVRLTKDIRDVNRLVGDLARRVDDLDPAAPRGRGILKRFRVS